MCAVVGSGGGVVIEKGSEEAGGAWRQYPGRWGGECQVGVSGTW